MKFTKETLKRTLRTFLQAFVSFLVVNYSTVSFTGDKATIKQGVIALLGSAVASGIAAIMNLETKESEEVEE